MPTREVTALNRGVLLAEDAALKAKLSGIYVRNPNNPSQRTLVKVGYRLPTNVKEREYPFISVDLIDIRFAAERAHSAQMTKIDYWPSEYATFQEYATDHDLGTVEVGTAEAVMWAPLDLYYQVQTFTRHAIHDRQITSTLLGTAYLPTQPGWGYLPVPEDDSQRWLDRLSVQHADYIEGNPENGARVFSKIYTVVVSAHQPPEDPIIYKKVSQVLAEVHDIVDPNVSESWTHEEPEEP